MDEGVAFSVLHDYTYVCLETEQLTSWNIMISKDQSTQY